MTIASQTSRISYTGDGVTTTFAIPFFFSANSDISIVLQDTLGNQTAQTLGTHYTLTGATLSAGGSCTFITSPTTGWLITIYRDPVATQTTSYNNNDPFPAKSHENALDKLTTLVQRAKDLASRAIRISDGEATINTALPPISVRKNRLIGFDDSGALIYPTGPNVIVNTIGPVPIPPQGKLTLQSGVAVPTSDIVSQNLYYAPAFGKVLPMYVGGFWTYATFTANSADQVGLTLAMAGSASWAADSLHDDFAVYDSGVLKLATRAWDAGMSPTEVAIANNSTITTGTGATAWARSTAAFDGVTVQANAAAARCNPSNNSNGNCLGQDWGVGVTKIVSKVVITASSDDFLRGDAPTVLQVIIEGSNDGTNFHVMVVHHVNASVVGQTYTLPVNVYEQLPYRYNRVSVTGNGTNSVNIAEVVFYNKVAPAAGRRLTLRDGIWVNDAVMTVRTSPTTTISIAQYEGTFLGTSHIDTATAGQMTAHVTYGPSRTYAVWNCYNRRYIKLVAGTYPAASSYVPTSQIWQPCENAISGSTFSLQVVRGLAEGWLAADLTRSAYLNATSAVCAYECGIGVDTTATFSGPSGSANIDITPMAIGFLPRAWLSLAPFAGMQTLYAIEEVNSGAGTVSCFTGPRSTQLVAEWLG